jgi:phage terminase small subunit
MGRRGPRANPMSGRSERRFGSMVRKLEQAAISHSPPPPNSLPERGRDYWIQHADVLSLEGRLSPPTYAAFAELCLLVAEREAVRAVIATEGRVVTSGRMLRRHPLIDVEEKFSRRIFEYEKAFGLVPSSREPVHGFPSKAPPSFLDDDDPFA